MVWFCDRPRAGGEGQAQTQQWLRVRGKQRSVCEGWVQWGAASALGKEGETQQGHLCHGVLKWSWSP